MSWCYNLCECSLSFDDDTPDPAEIVKAGFRPLETKPRSLLLPHLRSLSVYAKYQPDAYALFATLLGNLMLEEFMFELGDWEWSSEQLASLLDFNLRPEFRSTLLWMGFDSLGYRS
jgi:hypothetical protein